MLVIILIKTEKKMTFYSVNAKTNYKPKLNTI